MNQHRYKSKHLHWTLVCEIKCYIFQKKIKNPQSPFMENRDILEPLSDSLNKKQYMHLHILHKMFSHQTQLHSDWICQS